MNKVLNIGKPQIMMTEYDGQQRVRLVSQVIDGSNIRNKELYFEFDVEYADYLDDRGADAFVSMLIYYAMQMNLDIVSEAPISERLYYQLTTYFIPVLAQTTDFFHQISIIATTYVPTSGSEPAKGVACGFSGGVDSFYTIQKHLNHDLKSYRLTHLLFCDLPAQLVDPGNNTRDKAEQYTKENLSFLDAAAQELGLPIIVARTNVHIDFDTEKIVDKRHGLVWQAGFHAMKWAACIYAIRRLIGKYYYSSTHDVEHFTMHSSPYDTAYYDTFNVLMLNTEAVTFYSAGSEVSRIKKEEALADFVPAQKYLQVCGPLVDKNCSECKKCIRTQAGFFALGKLDNFEKVFDIEDFRDNFAQRIGRILGNPHDEFCQEILAELKKSGVQLPIASYGWAAMIRVIEWARRHLLKYRQSPVLRKIMIITRADVLTRGQKSTEQAK